MSLTEKPPFRLGINYWPARTAMLWWSAFERAEVERDFARIAAAGFDSVRVFLTWEAFQPTAGGVSQTHAKRLITTLDVAREAGLDVMPTLFTGHMSGVNWIPPWALGDAAGDDRFRVFSGGQIVDSRLASWYADAAIVQAQVLLAHELASLLAGHPALWAWDLGNENSNCGAAPDKASARDWLGKVTDAIRSADSSAKITTGLHMEDLEHDRNLGPHEAAQVCDFLTMHGYPGYAPWTDGPTDERLLPFLVQLTAWLSGGAEVLFSEFGVPTVIPTQGGQDCEQAAPGPALVSEQAAASYVARALPALQRCGGMGAMLWCYADYSALLWDRPPLDLAVHERSFGLWRADATPKPSVAAVRSFGQARAQLPKPAPPAQAAWLDIDCAQFYQSPELHLPRLFKRYCRAPR